MSKNKQVKSSVFHRDPQIRTFTIGRESAEFMGSQFEVFADHTCGIPILPIEGNLYYVSLSDVIQHLYNKWRVQLAFAQRFAAHGIRAFPDVDGVALATPLNSDELAAIMLTVISDVRKECLDGNEEVVRYV